ncbi:MAG: hypothetical protein D6757_00920 [Alphaproteobacteria bacterium]|nr:MAG: hypothetical protein D6757_00920 [Alphaproteobacteria bacterium]
MEGARRHQDKRFIMKDRFFAAVRDCAQPASLRVMMLAGAATLLLAACGQSDKGGDHQSAETPAATADSAGEQAAEDATKTPSGWGDAVRRQFIESCNSTSGGQEAYCACAAELSEKNYPDMAEFEAKMRSGDSEMVEFVQKKLIAACGDKIKRP